MIPVSPFERYVHNLRVTLAEYDAAARDDDPPEVTRFIENLRTSLREYDESKAREAAP